MCPISLVCLIFYNFKLQKIFGQDTKIIRGWGYFGKIFVVICSSCFMLFPTFLETYTTHKGYMTHELTTYMYDATPFMTELPPS